MSNMTNEKLKLIIQLNEEGLSSVQIGRKVQILPSNVVYWLKKEGIEYIPKRKMTPQVPYVDGAEQVCKICGIKKQIFEFYKNSRNGIQTAYTTCKTCLVVKSSKGCSSRHNKRKELAVNYKGGKCEICGYDRCLAALEFHHVDPTKKESGIANMLARSKASGELPENILEELDKCVLLCAICHREYHSGIIDLPS